MTIDESAPVVRATNTNRAVIKVQEAGNMSESWTSTIIDFHDMPTGYLQVYWEGAVSFGQENGYFEAYSSAFRNVATFSRIKGSRQMIQREQGAHSWNLGVIGFRYAFIKYVKGSITDGACIGVAVGKKT